MNIWKGATALRKLGHVLIRLLTQAGWDLDKEFLTKPTREKKKTRDLAEKKKKKLLRDFTEFDRKIMTATKSVLQRVTPCTQNCVDVLQPTEHMGEGEIICSQPCCLCPARGHTGFFKRSMRRGGALQQPGNVGKPSGGTDCDLCFPPHKSVSIWPFCVDNENRSCLQPLSEQLREAKILI